MSNTYETISGKILSTKMVCDELQSLADAFDQVGNPTVCYNLEMCINKILKNNDKILKLYQDEQTGRLDEMNNQIGNLLSDCINNELLEKELDEETNPPVTTTKGWSCDYTTCKNNLHHFCSYNGIYKNCGTLKKIYGAKGFKRLLEK